MTVINETDADLTVQSAGTAGGASWIQGEQAKQGASLQQYQSTKWGVSTNDANGIAQAHASLMGLGAFPINIVFTNDFSGQSSCDVTPNDQVQGVVTKVNTNEQRHSAYTVQLIPAVQGSKSK